MSPEVSRKAHVARVMDEVRKELQSLLCQRAATQKRIGTIKQTIMGLANLFGEEAIGKQVLDLVQDRSVHRQQPGFTSTCRRVLMESNRPLMTHEVCQEIGLRNPTLLAHHKEPMASVTTVLRRLVNYGEARLVSNDSGRSTWEWVADYTGFPPRCDNGKPKVRPNP
jgi:hypothetical protein